MFSGGAARRRGWPLPDASRAPCSEALGPLFDVKRSFTSARFGRTSFLLCIDDPPVRPVCAFDPLGDEGEASAEIEARHGIAKEMGIERPQEAEVR